MSSAAGVRRALDVELPVAVEALLLGCVALFAVALAAAFRPQFGWPCAALVTPVVCLLVGRRWKERRSYWIRLREWSRTPLAVDRFLIRQTDADGRPLGSIDAAQHYAVTWESFGNGRTVYRVSQNDQEIFVSTLAPDAESILRDVLEVVNYPGDDWANWDL